MLEKGPNWLAEIPAVRLLIKSDEEARSKEGQLGLLKTSVHNTFHQAVWESNLWVMDASIQPHICRLQLLYMKGQLLEDREICKEREEDRQRLPASNERWLLSPGLFNIYKQRWMEWRKEWTWGGEFYWKHSDLKTIKQCWRGARRDNWKLRIN